ncbi:unnamed protein product, partial [Adineta steineri]
IKYKMVGIDAQNKNILDKKFICSDCSLILRDPVQLTACGHRLCHSCSLNQNQAFVTCSQCQIQTPSDQILIDRAFSNEMQTLPIICSYCDWSDTLQNYEKHLQQLHPNPTCQYCSQQFNSIDQFNQQKASQCQNIPVECLLKDFGCPQQIRRSELSNHYRSEQHEHSIANELQQTKLSIDEQTVFVQEMNENLDISFQNLASSVENINDVQYSSCEGTLIWKITSFNEKMMDAKSERQPSIYSPPFYSRQGGYKMCARLYLNGAGTARRTHMSLFFVLMRGSYDAILKFPFNYKVTFCLYDQTSQQRHIIDSFQPDIKSDRFQRPRSEMNIASGISEFFALAMIQQEG